MKIEYYKEYSHNLGRFMEFKVFGHAGKPCLAFPSQNDRFYFYEDQGMINSIEQYISDGKIQVFCIDTFDYESWSATWKCSHDRIRAQEAYFKYVIEEIVPRIYEINNNPLNGQILTFGCSIGAYQAVNFYLRRPDIFNSVLALSGIYHTGFFINDYSDELTFLNSPIDSLKFMDINHPYIDLYKKGKIIICVGQGAYENDCVNETINLEIEMKRLNIPAWFDYWGSEYIHDWPSWRIQFPHFIGYFLQ